MNVNDYGVVMAFYTAYNMLTFTTISIEFWAPGVDTGSTPTLSVSNPAVSVPGTAFTYPGGSFPGGYYAKYTFAEGNITTPGVWSARVIYENTSPLERLISNVGTFVVGP